MANNSTIKAAKASPRIEAGNLKWYVGDSFQIIWQIELIREDEPIVYDPEDHIVFSFFTAERDPKPVYTFDFSNIQDNTVTLDFTPEVSAKFKAGAYSFCGKYIDKDGRPITIYANEHVEVQPCH